MAPIILVVCNEKGGYIFGRLLGKTQLSELSPKKTLEGFIGAFIVTMIASFIVSSLDK